MLGLDCLLGVNIVLASLIMVDFVEIMCYEKVLFYCKTSVTLLALC